MTIHISMEKLTELMNLSRRTAHEHWDEQHAKQAVGSTALVFISYYDLAGQLETQQNFLGRITHTSLDKGITVQHLDNGKNYRLPADTRAIQPLEKTGKAQFEIRYSFYPLLNIPGQGQVTLRLAAFHPSEQI